MKKFVLTATCMATLGLVSACDNKESVMMEAISAKIAEPICQRAPLNRTRLRDSEWGSIVQAWIDEGYVEKVNDGQDFSLWMASFVEPRFKFTEDGQEIITDGQFEKQICFGEREVTEITDMSEPYQDRGRTYIDVEASYEDKVTADWAKGIDNIEKTFNKSGNVKYRFVEHDKDGWVIDTPLR